MKNPELYKPDVRIFLFLIPLISAFNYFLTYKNIGWNTFTLFTYSVDTLQGYLAWWIVRSEVLWLDTKIDLLKYPFKRTLIQVILTTASGLGVIILTTELLSLLIKGKPAIPEFYTLDVLIIMIWFFVINGIYFGLFFYNTLTKPNLSETKTQEFQSFPVKYLNKLLLIPKDQVLGLRIEDEYVFLHTLDGKKYFLDESLDHWENILPESEFFRINRKSILSRKVIQGFQKLEHGKLFIELSWSAEVFELGVSRAKAPAFRTWFLQNT